MQHLQNDIRINQVGFLTNSQKRFVVTNNTNNEISFTVFSVENVDEIPVYTGNLSKIEEDGNIFYCGDFSRVEKEGDYFIGVGKLRSRQFIIYDDAYDMCKRILLSYFTYQRCGHPLGWNGSCHKDDGYIKETGEHVDLSGGYHQSCDLRKSPGGISIGLLSMIKAALKDKSEWGKILYKDEIRWACEYYLKTIQEDGSMYNTLNEPFGWEGRTFYKSPAPSSAQWNVTSFLSCAYIYLKDDDIDFAAKCLSAAMISFDYLVGEKRPKDLYKHPDKEPRGMDPDFFYDQCIIDSVSDISYQIMAASDLYRATQGSRFLNIIKTKLPVLQEHIKSGFALTRDDSDKGRLVSASCSYTWLMGGILSFCDAYELLGDINNLENDLVSCLDELCKYEDKSIWRCVQKLYSKDDLEVTDGFSTKKRKDSITDLTEYKNYFYSKKEIFEPSYSCYIGIFLSRMSKLLNNSKYANYAQSIVDNLLGMNILDSSHIYGVGYNHCQRRAYGQFFPSTPFIPGAVGTGYSSIDVYTSCSEYDMPCVGLAMYLLSEISS